MSKITCLDCIHSDIYPSYVICKIDKEKVDPANGCARHALFDDNEEFLFKTKIKVTKMDNTQETYTVHGWVTEGRYTTFYYTERDDTKTPLAMILRKDIQLIQVLTMSLF